MTFVTETLILVQVLRGVLKNSPKNLTKEKLGVLSVPYTAVYTPVTASTKTDFMTFITVDFAFLNSDLARKISEPENFRELAEFLLQTNTFIWAIN